MARLALDLGSAIVALSGAVVETQMPVAGRDVSQLLILVRIYSWESKIDRASQYAW